MSFLIKQAYFLNFEWPLYVYIQGGDDKIFILKKTTLQIYFKTFSEKIYSDNLIML